MKQSKNSYHYAVRRLKKKNNELVNNKFVEAALNNKIDIFKEIKNLRGSSDKGASTIDGHSDPVSISNHFSSIYKDLFNSVPSDDKVNDLLGMINEEIKNDEDIEVIALVDDNLVKEKMKSGKSDCTFDFGSDAFLHASDILAGPLSFMFKSFLIHGFVPIFLLICSLVPIVKDKLGNKSNSDNNRAIGISSILLKILTISFCCCSVKSKNLAIFNLFFWEKNLQQCAHGL